MIPYHAEKRAQGPLIAFIDLLFLLVAFFTLLLFFVQKERTVAEEELQQTQQRLEAVEQEKTTVEAMVESLSPFTEQITALREAEAEKRRREAARAMRRRAKDRVKVEYQVLENGMILHEGEEVSLERFLTEVIEPLRRRHWIGFYGYARPETPFGRVVETRARLLQNQGEFDTYWDNVSRER